MQAAGWHTHTHTHTHKHPFNGPLSRITQVSRYQKGKTNLIGAVKFKVVNIIKISQITLYLYRHWTVYFTKSICSHLSTCWTYILYNVCDVDRNSKWLSWNLHCSILNCKFSNILLSQITKFLFTKPSWVSPVQQQASCDFELQQFQQAQHHCW